IKSGECIICKSAAIQHNIVAVSFHCIVISRPYEILILLILIKERVCCTLDGSVLIGSLSTCLTYRVIKQANKLLFVLDNLTTKRITSTLNFCKFSLFLPELWIACELRLSRLDAKSIKYQF